MKNGDSLCVDPDDNNFAARIEALEKRIYNEYLPPYLRNPSSGGRVAGYDAYIREQLNNIVLSEIWGDTERLSTLEAIENWVALILGMYGTTFRILDHIGMHLRGQTFGQYELYPDDLQLLRKLCKQLLENRPLELTPFS